MRLLVSVRASGEVEAAVLGGAEIIDAKEPMRGSLGMVDSAELARIARQIPEAFPFSIALGDHATPDGVARALELTAAVARRPAELYVKVGFAGVNEAETARSVLEAAVAAARRSPLRPDVVAVAYADHRDAGAIDPQMVLDVAAGAGARGVLLDTWRKDGRALFAWTAPTEVRRWLHGARSRGLLNALAGSLGLDQMDVVRELDPDVLGVRGAACENGRDGVVNERLVRQLSMAKGRPQPSYAIRVI
jgi:(5-formylfuran-3-yl)methyl phosphate synthase